MAAGSTLVTDTHGSVTASAVSLASPFGLDTSKALTGQVSLDAAGNAEVHSSAEAGRSQLHCSARIVQALPISGQQSQ